MNPEYNIPYILKSRFRKLPNKFPGTLVIALPQLNLESSNTKDLELSSDVPFKIDSTGAKENSLPWSLHGEGFSVYTLAASLASALPGSEGYHIWKPASWTMYLAAAHSDAKTSKDPQNPFLFLHDSLSKVGVRTVFDRHGASKRSKELMPSLGFCVHIDLASVLISISRQQVTLIIY